MQETKSWSRRLLKAGLYMAAGAVALVVFVVATIAVSEQSKANRAFQRETHKPCGYCHVPGNEPELGSRGIQFRNCGYSTRCWGGGGGGGGGGRHGGRCQPGWITCAAFCDKYDSDPHACKYTARRSCVRLHGKVSTCIRDRAPD